MEQPPVRFIRQMGRSASSERSECKDEARDARLLLYRLPSKGDPKDERPFYNRVLWQSKRAALKADCHKGHFSRWFGCYLVLWANGVTVRPNGCGHLGLKAAFCDTTRATQGQLVLMRFNERFACKTTNRTVFPVPCASVHNEL